MNRMAVSGLPPAPLAAMAAFHAEWAPRIAAALAAGDDVAVLFDPADHTHRGWRLAAIQALARAHAPRRINAVAGGNAAAQDAACAYLAAAGGVTGQYLPLDDGSGQAVVSSGQ